MKNDRTGAGLYGRLVLLGKFGKYVLHCSIIFYWRMNINHHFRC